MAKSKNDYSDVSVGVGDVAGDSEWKGLTREQVSEVQNAEYDAGSSRVFTGGEPSFGGYSLRKVVELSGLTERNIRYYIQKGLLSGPSSRGRDAAYSTEFLVTAIKIFNLRKDGLSTKEIKRGLAPPIDGLGVFLQALDITMGDEYGSRMIEKCRVDHPEPADSKIEIVPGIYFGLEWEMVADNEVVECLEQVADYMRFALLEISKEAAEQ
jgi:DNA-binding transcriptional MerR regulator